MAKPTFCVYLVDPNFCLYGIAKSYSEVLPGYLLQKSQARSQMEKLNKTSNSFCAPSLYFYISLQVHFTRKVEAVKKNA